LSLLSAKSLEKYKPDILICNSLLKLTFTLLAYYAI
jgi:hypothetical protein